MVSSSKYNPTGAFVQMVQNDAGLSSTHVLLLSTGSVLVTTLHTRISPANFVRRAPVLCAHSPAVTALLGTPRFPF